CAWPFVFFSSRRRHTRFSRDWSSDVCSSDLVEFDAETKDRIQFNGQQYVFKPTGNKTGIHELAVALNGEGTIAFPTWVLLDQEFNPLFRHKGALAPSQIQELIVAIEQHESNSQKPNNDNQ